MYGTNWKDRWQQYLKQGESSEEIVDAAEEEFSKRARNVLEALNPQSPLRPAYERMLAFCSDARDELIALTKAGANPAIVIRLANPPLTLVLAHGEADEGASEFETIKPPKYWKRKVKVLESASNDLAEFMKTRLYRAAQEDQFTPVELRLSPFARICMEVQTTKLAIDRLVQAIRGEHLDSGARKLTYSAPYVFLETDMVDPNSPAVEEWEQVPGHPLPYAWWKRTKPVGARGPKPDSPRRDEGDGPAYALWKYLAVRTGKPRVSSVARLISSAGWDSPVQSGVDEFSSDTLRKHIEKLAQDPGVTLSWGDRIAALEVDFEGREHLNYGGFLMHLEKQPPDEPERTE